jgi:hypothetical protein
MLALRVSHSDHSRNLLTDLASFTAYVSSLILAHSAAHMKLDNCPEERWQNELAYMNMCLKLLDFCSSADSVARNFRDIGREFYNILRDQADAHNEPVVDISDLPETSFSHSFDHLRSSSAGSTPLHEVSRKLDELIKYPFSSPLVMEPQDALSPDEISIGAHLDLLSCASSPFNHPISDGGGGPSELSRAMSGISQGQFLQSRNPHQWVTTTPVLP